MLTRPLATGTLALLALTTTPFVLTGQAGAIPIDSIFGQVAATGPGCAVAVSHAGELLASRGYGLADLERGIPITPATVFDAGSLTKQFVAAAVLLLVDEGRIALSDDIRRYLPELPDYGSTITIDHLLTHTSGLRDWTGLQPLSSGDDDALTIVLRQRGLNFLPGEEWSYSNSGYVLLKVLVTRVSGTTFGAVAQTRLFEPLGMAATTYTYAPQSGHPGLAVAYEKKGDDWVRDVLAGNDRGGGGALLSTARDLLIWTDALAEAKLGPFVTTKLQEPARLNNGRMLGYARGLILDESRGEPRILHSGSAAGYKSLLVRYPDPAISIALMCNAGESIDRTLLARQLRDLVAPPPAIPTPREPVASSDEVDVSARAGLYFSENTGDALRLIAGGGRLRMEGGPPLEVLAADRFRNPEKRTEFLSGDMFELRFVSPDVFEMRSMEGTVTRFQRGIPGAPTADALQAFVGPYQSDEVRARFDVAAEGDRLVIRLNGSRPFPLSPVDRDTYQLGRMIMRFLRDSEGSIIAIDYSNPVVRHIRFPRIVRPEN